MRITQNNGHKGAMEFHADKPILLRPKITGSKEIDGVLHYIGENGKLFIASIFDKMFTPLVKFTQKSKTHKGRLIWRAAMYEPE